MKCAEVRAMAESYLAGELPVDTNHAVLAHLERCPACRAELEARERLRQTLRRAFTSSSSLAPDPEFVARIAASAHERAAARPFGRRSPASWLAVAASLMLVLVAGWWLTGPDRNEGAPAALSALAAHAAGDHRFCALEHALDEAPISLEEAARRYGAEYAALRAVVAGSPVVQSGEAEVIGAHWCVYKGRRFAHVVVRQREHIVSVLLTPVESAGPAAMTAAGACPSSDGFQVACFDARGHAGFVVSDLTGAENLALARELAPVLQSYFGRV